PRRSRGAGGGARAHETRVQIRARCAVMAHMRTYVAFLGGINVGGHRVTMERLRAEFETLGFADVSTFIASGNVVFGAEGARTALEPAIEAHLAERLGYPVPTFVRAARDVVRVATLAPF